MKKYVYFKEQSAADIIVTTPFQDSYVYLSRGKIQ